MKDGLCSPAGLEFDTPVVHHMYTAMAVNNFNDLINGA